MYRKLLLSMPVELFFDAFLVPHYRFWPYAFFVLTNGYWKLQIFRKKPSFAKSAVTCVKIVKIYFIISSLILLQACERTMIGDIFAVSPKKSKRGNANEKIQIML